MDKPPRVWAHLFISDNLCTFQVYVIETQLIWKPVNGIKYNIIKVWTYKW